MLFLDKLARSERIVRIADAMGGGKPPVAVFGVSGISATLCAAATARAADSRLIFLTETDAQAATACSDLKILGVRAMHFCSRDFVFADVESASHDAEQQRLYALGRIANGMCDAVCVSVEAFCQPTIPPDELSSRSVYLKRGERYDRDELLKKLVRAGYSFTDTVEGAGQFGARGGIVDVFPCSANSPIRLDFFGDVLDELYSFDKLTQRRVARLDSFFITPAREVLIDDASTLEEFCSANLPDKLADIVRRDVELAEGGSVLPSADRYMPLIYPKRAALRDYIRDAVLFICENASVRERYKNLASRASDDMLALADEGLLTDKQCAYFQAVFDVSGLPSCLFESFARSMGGGELSDAVTVNTTTSPRWSGEIRQLVEDVGNYRDQKLRVAVLAGTKRAANALARDLTDAGFEASVTDKLEGEASVSVCPFTLSAGFVFLDEGLCVVSARREQQEEKRARSRFSGEGRGIGSLEELSAGDYVVHVNHGIGVFDGIETIDFHGTIKDYIKIKYRGTDLLYVPVTQLDMVALYSAPSDKTPPQLAKLNSGEWAKTKQTVYRSARDMAKELIELYSKRSLESGVSFSADTEWQKDFEARFQYEETDDQLRSIDEIKRDMERAAPMDRLLCGDVGVGKTEVALRAAFKAVNDGYQVAVLVPTTILAWQHFNSFISRLETYPVNVAMLSRFSSARQIKNAVKGIANGTVDIAVGTHRLIQKDVNFKRLGLLIIDEEQRFGVGHKEKLKAAFPGVDVLTLSATPIPRTLNMVMSGIRDMSRIDEPPHGRQPVQTYVMEYDEARIADAIRQELSRGGQLYYIHNRIDSIERCAAKLAQLAPDARIAIGHGRMDEAELSRVWQKLIDGECDILVCTTIIETGVDVPNVNTLIIEDADDMGLAQLYQLRGRVGRSSRRAYAYFTFRRNSVLTDVAAKRLAAIRDFTGFGSGFKIAMRDLQIRGAGSVLSARQSGHMHAVGYDMYLKILSDAIADEQGLPKKETVDCLVDIVVDAHLPTSYIRDNKSRIEMYKRIAAINSDESAQDVENELADRFGKPPAAAADLISIALIRTLASEIGIYEIRQQGNTVFMYWDNLDLDAVRKLLALKLRDVQICRQGKSYLSISLEKDEPCCPAVHQIVAALWHCKALQ